MKTTFTASRGFRPGCRAVVVAATLSLLSGCSAIYSNHGYIPPQEDLEQIVVGIDTRSTVEEVLGTSGSTSVREDDAIYFVRSRMRTFAMLDPEVVERDVVAVSFNDSGVVTNIETFGLERGQVVRLTRRVTDSSVAGKSFLRQLAGNIGNFRPGGFGGDP